MTPIQFSLSVCVCVCVCVCVRVRVCVYAACVCRRGGWRGLFGRRTLVVWCAMCSSLGQSDSHHQQGRCQNLPHIVHSLAPFHTAVLSLIDNPASFHYSVFFRPAEWFVLTKMTVDVRNGIPVPLNLRRSLQKRGNQQIDCRRRPRGTQTFRRVGYVGTFIAPSSTDHI